MNHVQQFAVQGELLSTREEFAIANWTGAQLEQRFSTYDEAHEVVKTMIQEAEKQGFSVGASKLAILRREITEIAGDWRTIG